MRLAGAAGEAADERGVTDGALVTRLLDGDAGAGNQLVERHAAALLGYLKRMVRGDAQLAEDLHQATWASALEHLGQFDPAGAGPGFKAWLYRIATNKAHDHFRRSGRERRRLGKIADDPTMSRWASEESDDPVVADERSAALRRAVAALPAPQRQVVELRCFAGLKFTEIAEVAGCPLNTALGRMHKAVKKLRHLIGPEVEA